jgi:hypothetical protein
MKATRSGLILAEQGCAWPQGRSARRKVDHDRRRRHQRPKTAKRATEVLQLGLLASVLLMWHLT